MALIDQYRKVLTDKKKVDELVKELSVSDLVPLMVKYRGLEKIEGDELKSKYRSNTRERNRKVMELILEKDSLASYTALSQVVHFKNQYVWSKMFEFSKGTFKDLVVQPISSVISKPIQPAADQPSVLWICADDNTFKKAADTHVISDTPLKTTVQGVLKYYELPSLNDYDVNVWLCKASAGNVSSLNFPKLYQTYNRTRYCILTGTCRAVNEPDYQLGDICVTKRSRSCTTAFVASIEQQTALWERRNDKGGWYCQHREDGYSKVVFGKVGRNHSDRGVDFCSEEALKFCESSEEAYKKGTRMPHMAILMATADGRSSERCDCRDTSISHAIGYSEKVVQYLVETLTLMKCRSGRPPFP